MMMMMMMVMMMMMMMMMMGHDGHAGDQDEHKDEDEAGTTKVMMHDHDYRLLLIIAKNEELFGTAALSGSLCSELWDIS